MSNDANLEIQNPQLLASAFEERAENLSKRELTEWTQETPRGREILTKLKGPGAKLVSGPRGCGKSTYLRRAYFELLDGAEVLPAYINYAKSLALEPLFHHRANALQVFRQWLLAKIVVGLKSSFDDLGKTAPEYLVSVAVGSARLIRELETGTFDSLGDELLAPTNLLELLECWTRDNGFRRCVLLMDDAAHAFSPDQQREFFEVFRTIRSRVVSSKAAVYPGITSYSAHFHVGHEAELIEAWNPPDDPAFLSNMAAMVERRLPPELFCQLAEKRELIDYLALASFGLPRGFLNMVQQLLSVEEDKPVNATRTQAELAVKSHVESVRGIYGALRRKLPRFKHFVTVGDQVENEMSNSLRKFNEGRPNDSKAVVVAVKHPIEKELERVFSLLEYAGLIRSMDKVSRGEKGVFQRYMLHYAVVITDNALNLGKSFGIGSIVTALTKRDAHAFVRVQGASLLGEGFEEKCKLDLPPCQKCQAPRLEQDQRFCMRCGAQLADASVYTDLLHAPISKLPLTNRKKEDLQRHTSISRVQDILLDEDMQQILSVPGIGPVWAARIRNAAEEYVSV